MTGVQTCALPISDAARPAGLLADADAGVWRAPDGTDWLIFTRTLRAPAAGGTGGVVLHSGIPLQVLATRAWESVGGQVPLVWAMGLVVIGLGTLLLLRWERLTRPEAAVEFAADDPAERRATLAMPPKTPVAAVLGQLSDNELQAVYRKIVDGQAGSGATPPLWDGRAAGRIVEILTQVL